MDGLIGKKIGMTSIFDDKGQNLACTVVEVQPNHITQIKEEDSDGYFALQLAAFDKRKKSTTKALHGHFSKANVDSKKIVREFRDFEIDKKVGDTISVDEIFNEGDSVNVSGFTKGKGFQGVVKRHGFAGVGDATHGQHNRMRAPGSIGGASDPSKVFKGMRMAGRTGNNKVKIKNLEVLKVFGDKNLVLVKGAVPGHKGSYVIIEKQ